MGIKESTKSLWFETGQIFKFLFKLELIHFKQKTWPYSSLKYEEKKFLDEKIFKWKNI